MLVVLAFAACVLLSLLVPAQAQAKSYDMPQTVINATVEDDGDLHVIEQRTFDFSGDFTAVWWSFDSLPQGAALHIAGVRMADGAVDEASSWETLSSVPFQMKWRDEGGPGTTSYSVDGPEDIVYVFFDESDTTVTIELDYTVTDAVRAFADVGELYWKFVGSGWQEASNNVLATITLPSSGQAVQVGEDVRAWGHGPLDSTVEIGADGSVVYQVPSVSAGSYAEARIVFPSGWLAGVQSGDANDYRSTMRLDEVIEEEQEWADSANAQRTYFLVTLLVGIVVCLAVLIYGIVSFRRYGRELAPTFVDEYWRDEPVPGEHPAVVGRLCRFDREDPDDFTATVLHLANLGALRIEQAGEARDYRLTRIPNAELSLNSEIDRKAMGLLFDTVAEGRDSLLMRDIRAFAQGRPQEFSDALADWQGVVSARSIAGEYFESYSQAKRSRMAAIAVLLVAACIALSIVFDNPLMAVPGLITGLALFAVSRFMDRRTQKGADAYARCKALKKWLCEFSSLDERPPTDVKVWGEFMVYAFVFGVAEQAMRELRAAVPDAVDRYGRPGSTDAYVPWWVWYSSAWHGGAGLADVGTSLHDSLSQSMSAVVSTLGEGFSSGGGMGGGFSVGGGGGFGGGGGAR